MGALYFYMEENGFASLGVALKHTLVGTRLYSECGAVEPEGSGNLADLA